MSQDAALVLPFQWDRNKTKLGNFSQRALARLKPGVTMAQADAGHGAAAADGAAQLSGAGRIQR